MPAAVCLSALVRHKSKQDEERLWVGSQWKETGYVFTTRNGTPMDARDLLRDYYRIARPKTIKGKEAPVLKFPPIRFHDLRHSAATILLAQGVSPDTSRSCSGIRKFHSLCRHTL